MSAFQARFDGTCIADCGSRIHPGDWVTKTDHGYLHVECAPVPSRFDIQPGETVCPDCRLTICRCDS